MGKKKNVPFEEKPPKKRKKEKEIEKFPIDVEVANFEARYPSILPFVDSTLIRRLYETSIPIDSQINGVSWNITTNFIVEKKFFLALKELVLEGDIDLEIAIVEQFMSIGRMLIRKLGYKGDDIDHKVENAITETIENYLGKDGFKSSLLQELKISVNGKKENSSLPTTNIPEVTSTIPSLVEPIGETLEEKSKVPSVPVTEERKIVIPEDGKLRPPTTLDQLIFNVDILRNVPLNDATYISFLTLKYGYHEGKFFSLIEISEILSISVEKARDYYLQSLQFLKDWFGLQLDHYYTYLKENKKVND